MISVFSSVCLLQSEEWQGETDSPQCLQWGNEKSQPGFHSSTLPAWEIITDCTLTVISCKKVDWSVAKFHIYSSRSILLDQRKWMEIWEKERIRLLQQTGQQKFGICGHIQNYRTAAAISLNLVWVFVTQNTSALCCWSNPFGQPVRASSCPEFSGLCFL